jgi:hypothetical protein
MLQDGKRDGALEKDKAMDQPAQMSFAWPPS